MHAQLFAALFALGGALAASSEASEPPPPSLEADVVTIDGVEVNSAVLSTSMVEVLLGGDLITDDNQLLGDDNQPLGDAYQLLNATLPDSIFLEMLRQDQQEQQQQQQERLRRRAPTKPPPDMITAEAASQIKSVHNNRKGVFYRGDTRAPDVIFKRGFEPKGTNLNYENHFRYAGDSGFVSVSRGRDIAARYTSGHMSLAPKGGYVYVIAHNNVPDGIWVSGVRPNDKTALVKQEFMVAGKIPASSISHVYEIDDKNPKARWKRINNANYAFKSSPSCFGRRRAACDPVKFVRKPPTSAGSGKFGKTVRIGARLGSGIAFAAAAPFAHQILNLLKEWDHPIGHSVQWLDGAIASVQQFIGGEQVPTIHGNVLKMTIICAARRGLTGLPVDEDCRRWYGDAPDEQPPLHPGRTEEVKSINFVLDACRKLDDEEGIIVNEEWMQEAAEGCADLHNTLEILGC